MIPIQNIYYMLSYAWGHIREAQTLDLSGMDCETPQDLLGFILARAVKQMLRQGLDRDYLLYQQDLHGIRGRIAIGETTKRALRPKGEVSCVFDELTYDVLQNRIVYSTLKALSSTEAISADIVTELRLAASRFPRVTPIKPTGRDFHSIQIHRNNRFYRFVLNICQLIHENLLVEDSSSGRYRFFDFRRDEAQMGKLFEYFVRNFLGLALSDINVSAPKVRWAVEANERSIGFLPEMQTDIVLHRGNRFLIVDTKFYKDPINSYRGGERIISSNLYQILSYVSNAAVTSNRSYKTGGMLLYAETGRDLRIDYTILGYPIRIRSINLNQPWRGLHGDLISIVSSCLDEL